MPPQETPTIATVVEPSNRPRLDAAAEGAFTAIHTDTVPDVIRAVRERPVRAVLVSPSFLGREQVGGVSSLVQRFPGVPTVAVVSRYDAPSAERLLQLGASGVRRLLDLSEPEGWHRLRALIADEATPTGARVLVEVMPALGDPTPDCAAFFQGLVRLAPGVTTVRALVRFFGIQPSTFMSRFFRAHLPSPKRYLAALRIVFAAALLEEGGLSIADVAYRLEYSSPQSFGRHVRAVVGMTAGEFRRRHGFASSLRAYCQRLIVPFRPAFRQFHPLNRHGMRLGPGA